MIDLKNVCKTFHEGKTKQVQAVRNITLNLPAKQTTVIKGSSGSGKTTVLTMIGGLSRPSSGRISLNGEITSNLPERFLSQIRRETFGFIFQRFHLIRGMTVLENVMLPAYPLGLSHAHNVKQAMELLQRVSLVHKANSTVDVLSGGEAQRVAIARALMNNPSIIIADEPTANLDTGLSLQFLMLMRELKDEGRTIIMTSHDPRIWQADLVDRVITMEDGQIIASRADEEKD